MKRISSYLFALMACASLSFLTSCGEDTDPLPTETLPAAEGLVTIEFLNYPGANPEINVASGEVVAVAVKMTKGANGRPQKLRVYETNTLNTRGTQVGSTIDLRTSLDEQTKNVNYTVPATNGKTYLYFEVDESGGKFSRKILTLNVGGAGGINTWKDIVLGGSGNDAPATMGSSTGQTYKVAGGAESDAAANITDIDITYIESNSATSGPWLASYPARSKSPFGLNAGIQGGTSTYFEKATVTAAQFDAIADVASLNTAIGSVTSTKEYYPEVGVKLSVGDVVKFKNNKNKLGLIKVVSITPGNTGTMKIEVKVQR